VAIHGNNFGDASRSCVYMNWTWLELVSCHWLWPYSKHFSMADWFTYKNRYLAWFAHANDAKPEATTTLIRTGIYIWALNFLWWICRAPVCSNEENTPLNPPRLLSSCRVLWCVILLVSFIFRDAYATIFTAKAWPSYLGRRSLPAALLIFPLVVIWWFDGL
jgi:hypothetical protein